MTEFIQFGSKQIDFHLEYSDRKSLGITVTPDLEVFVKAPDGTSLEMIKEELMKKAPWIIRQQSFFLNFHPKTPERKFIGGESHLYLGRQYRLKVVQSSKVIFLLNSNNDTFVMLTNVNEPKRKFLI